MTRAGITATSMAAHLIGDVKEQGRDALVLVGHAEAAPIVQLTAAALAHLVRRVVIVGGPLLVSGESLASMSPDRYAALAADGEDRDDKTAELPEALWHSDFANDTPASSWRGRFRSAACPVGWLTDRPELDPFWDLHRLGVLPVSYVALGEDRYAQRYEAIARERLREPVTATVPGPLAAPCTQPGPLAAALLAVSGAPR
jgi:hypothetical protein